MAWPAQEGRQLRGLSPVDTLIKSVLGLASSREVVEILAMLANSLQVLPYSLRAIYHKSNDSFPMLLESRMISLTSVSATSGASLSFAHYQG
jgi:hypothetical protein